MNTSTTMSAIPLTYHFKAYANSTITDQAVITRILHGASKPVLKSITTSPAASGSSSCRRPRISRSTPRRGRVNGRTFLVLTSAGYLKVFSDDQTSGTVRFVGEAFTAADIANIANVQEVWLGNYDVSGSTPTTFPGILALSTFLTTR